MQDLARKGLSFDSIAPELIECLRNSSIQLLKLLKPDQNMSSTTSTDRDSSPSLKIRYKPQVILKNWDQAKHLEERQSCGVHFVRQKANPEINKSSLDHLYKHKP